MYVDEVLCIEKECWNVVQGTNSRPKDVKPGDASGTLQSHCEDLACVLRTLPSQSVVVGHSFGGLLLQKYLELSQKDECAFPAIKGAVFLASAPPSGIDVLRYMLNAPIRSFKVSFVVSYPLILCSVVCVCPAPFHCI
jgi:pimeloyl-ACP methyl ester carboxylesterase